MTQLLLSLDVLSCGIYNQRTSARIPNLGAQVTLENNN